MGSGGSGGNGGSVGNGGSGGSDGNGGNGIIRAARAAAWQCVSPHLSCLRWCGFCRLTGTGTGQGALFAAHDAYRAFTLLLTSLYLIQECIYAYQESDDMEKLSRVMFLLLCHVTSLCKQLVFYQRAAHIDRLELQLHDGSFGGGGAPGAALRTASAAGARRLLRLYAGAAVLTCALWLALALADHATGLHVEFYFWLPRALAPGPDRQALFGVVLMYQWYVTTLVAVANTTMDAFMVAVLSQCSTQLQIVRKSLETVWERADESVKNTHSAGGGGDCTPQSEGEEGEDGERVRLRLLLSALRHYDRVAETVELFQNIFGGAILVQFAIGGWILCMAAYKLASLSVLSVEFASMWLFMWCILTELFLYCHYGTSLSWQSSLLGDALYGCGWHRERGGGRVMRLARAVLLAGERARRPLAVKVAHVLPLSRDTFLKVLKSSYTFYAVLRQTK